MGGHAAIKELVIQKSKMYLILVSDSGEYKKTNVAMKILWLKQVTKNMKMFCWKNMFEILNE